MANVVVIEDHPPVLKLLSTLCQSEGHEVMAFDNGRVQVIKIADGMPGRSIELGQPVSLGPRAYGKKILVTSIDGTLYRIESLLAPPPAADDSGGE